MPPTTSTQTSPRGLPIGWRQVIPDNLTAWLLASVAIIYALLAGLHTLQDFDLGWQLASGRWIIQHHRLFSTDVFSYTARGASWIYPALSGLLFYLAYLIGGYTLLSWLGAMACATTVGLLIRRNGFAAAALALVAVPVIANRTQPRAEMFTTVLFAAFLSLLWGHDRAAQERSSGRLWLLPILMVLWVNLHPGFVAGLALCAAYLVLELLRLPVAANHRAVRSLWRAWPWLALTLAATLANPWGPRIYLALLRQERGQQVHTSWLVEWENIRPSLASLHQALRWRDPQSSFWWLLALAAACGVIALLRKRWGGAVLLASASYLALQHVRFQALFACVVVIIGSSLLRGARDARRNVAAPTAASQKRNKSRPAHLPRPTAALLTLTTLLTVLAAVRSWDLISDRYYLGSSQLASFGTGLSWWFPERAVDFIHREKLPANIFNTYSLGGYLMWRLFPEYSDYIDGRALPFGSQLFFRAYDLSIEPPDSAVWQQEEEARSINTIIAPLGRYSGIDLFPQLPAFCHSQSWRPVYLDEVSVVFVRRTPETASLVDRLQLDCDKASFASLNGEESRNSMRVRARIFNSWANSAGVLYGLGRYSEALTYLDRASTLFPSSANLHLTRALVFEHTGHVAEAEQEFRTSLELEPTDEAWFDLGLLYMTQKRYAEAADIFRRSAQSSPRPHDMWMMLGQADLQLNQPQGALGAFDRAEASSPFHGNAESFGAGFNSLIATGRAKAWYQLGDVPRAVEFQQQAVKLAPNDAKLWLGLADLYEVQGRTTMAAEARERAKVQ